MEYKKYGLFVRVKANYVQVLDTVRAALKAEGFGVLTEIDVKSTLKQKLDADFRRYDIIGACNPPLAHAALQKELDIGLLLPCNVIVYEEGEGCVVGALDPEVMMSATGNESLQAIASDARSRLERALLRVESLP